MRKLLVLLAAVIGVIVGVPATSSAGGWVVVSLDSTPAVHSDEDVEIGFTVLRHGRTPESSDDLALLLIAPDGTSHRFEAAQQGAVGHHVATIRLPEAGEYRWMVTGQFVDADLGTLDVTAPPGGASWKWDVVQWGSAALALVMAALVALDFRSARRDRRTTPVAA